MRTTWWWLVAVALCACGTDGANGENGKVRFSMVFNAQETSDFTPPVAVGSSLLIKLEEPSSKSAGEASEPGFPELELQVQPVGHKGTSKVLPLGFAQYAIQLDAEGDYRLVAMDGKTELDSLKLASKRADHIRLAPKANRTSTAPAPSGGTCIALEAVDVKDGLTLAKNQSISYFITAADADDEAMLGLLGLTAHEDTQLLELDTPWILENGQPNGVIVSPNATLGEKAKFTVNEASGLTLQVELETTDKTVTPSACK